MCENVNKSENVKERKFESVQKFESVKVEIVNVGKSKREKM